MLAKACHLWDEGQDCPDGYLFLIWTKVLDELTSAAPVVILVKLFAAFLEATVTFLVT
jgi:hypothetical protein